MNNPVQKIVATSKVTNLQPTIYRRETQPIPSLNVWITGPINTKPSQYYTGDQLVGISQMAKSNAVPVFNYEHVIDISRMRR